MQKEIAGRQSYKTPLSNKLFSMSTSKKKKKNLLKEARSGIMGRTFSDIALSVDKYHVRYHGLPPSYSGDEKLIGQQFFSK